MTQALMSIADTQARIASGARLLLAGDEAALAQLPRGAWIAGTIPYFMAAGGGVVARDRIFVTELPDFIDEIAIQTYDADGLAQVFRDGPSNGFTALIVPAGSKAHERFAMDAPRYAEFGSHPLVGWIAGVHLADLGTVAPKVFAGWGGAPLGDRAVAMHVHMRPGKAVEVGIVNLFTQGAGDAIVFPHDAMQVGDALINGERQNFADYVTAGKLDTKLPLVADYCGASINVSFQQVGDGEVRFYAPVFAGVEYRHARPVGDYVTEFMRQVPPGGDRFVFACNCILNFLYSELEGKTTGGVVGPITFGEIAYQLLNQTMVYVQVVDTV